MGKHKFDRKKSVRFSLVPGPEVNGHPTCLFNPVETMRNKVGKKDRKKIVSQIADYDEITINGRVIEDDEIPQCVLDQIRNRKDLLFNQMRGEEEQEEGDLYDIQDGVEDKNDFEDYSDEDEGSEGDTIKEEKHEGGSDEDWSDDEEGKGKGDKK